MVWCKDCEMEVFGSRTEGGLLYCDSCAMVFPSFAGESQASGDILSSGMVWCKHCENVYSGVHPIGGAYLACKKCLKEVTFIKNELMKLRDALQIGDDSDAVVDMALRIFGTAADVNFPKGRRSELVLASCLYLACREKNVPALLIDFTSYLRVSFYELGSVYFQLCELYTMVKNENYEDYEELVDPSVFIPRFANGLLKSGHDDETTTKVIETAMNIIASMNIGDWSQTSRKPGVSCGAAIYIAALSHDIADMGEETITYILNESEAASLTVEELKKREKSILLKKPFTPRPNFDKEVVNCKPKDSKSVGYGLCKDCHKKFIEVSAAFQQAEKERMEREENEEEESESDDPDGDESDNPSGLDGDPVNAPPASTAFEACTRMLDSKGISHMFNHDRLKELLDPSVSKKKEDEEVPEEDEEQDKK